MKKLLVLMLLLLVTGCSSEKAQVESYIEQCDAIFREFMKLGGEYENLGKELMTSLGGRRDPASVQAAAKQFKGKIDELHQKMKAVEDRLEKLQPPEKARTLHEQQVKTLQSFESALAAYDQLTAELMTGAPNKLKLMGLAKDLQGKLQQSQQLAAVASQEREKLLKEFDISPQATP